MNNFSLYLNDIFKEKVIFHQTPHFFQPCTPIFGLSVKVIRMHDNETLLLTELVLWTD